ncbi:MAG: hypothetical protein V4629_01645 [Pseudomonadota bacterium]
MRHHMQVFHVLNHQQLGTITSIDDHCLIISGKVAIAAPDVFELFIDRPMLSGYQSQRIRFHALSFTCEADTELKIFNTHFSIISNRDQLDALRYFIYGAFTFSHKSIPDDTSPFSNGSL